MTNHFNRKIAALTLSVKYEIAWLKMHKARCDVSDALREEKYRADQPRAPKGTAEGGQWIVDPGSARQRRLLNEIAKTAGIAEDLEDLGGGVPRLVLTPKGATQFIFPNGMILRFDIQPGQYRPKRGPHINLILNGINYHLYLN